MIRWISLAQFEALTPEQRKNGDYGIDLELDNDTDRRRWDVGKDVADYGRDGWDGPLS